MAKKKQFENVSLHNEHDNFALLKLYKDYLISAT